jgi:putative transcription antitermination factor YqgF
MNYLAIDYGTKRIGLAYSINDIIFTLPMVKNDDNFFKTLSQMIIDYHLEKIYVGLSEGQIANMTKTFVVKLKSMLNLPIETVEEAVSTIEAQAIFKKNKNTSKSYSQQIDSIAAAVILNRVISS